MHFLISELIVDCICKCLHTIEAFLLISTILTFVSTEKVGLDPVLEFFFVVINGKIVIRLINKLRLA